MWLPRQTGTERAGGRACERVPLQTLGLGGLGRAEGRRWGAALAFYVKTVIKFLMQLSH